MCGFRLSKKGKILLIASALVSAAAAVGGFAAYFAIMYRYFKMKDSYDFDETMIVDGEVLKGTKSIRLPGIFRHSSSFSISNSTDYYVYVKMSGRKHAILGKGDHELSGHPMYFTVLRPKAASDKKYYGTVMVKDDAGNTIVCSLEGDVFGIKETNFSKIVN